MTSPILTLAELLAPYRTISIIGMAKNVGKTTTLNHLIEAFHRSGTSLGLTSIGRDGERVDIVTKTEKPEIFVYKNTVIATAEKLLPLCDITKEIIMSTEINTPFGRVVLVRALSDGFIQLSGPSMTAQIADLLEHISGDKVLVDCAVSRKTLANPSVTHATILCTGAGFSRNMHKTIAETKHVVDMLTLPKFKGAIDSDECMYISGAVTDSMVSGLIMTSASPITIVAEDSSKIFIKPATYEKLRIKKINLEVLHPIHLAGITINPFSPYHAGYDPADFLARMCKVVEIPVFDLKSWTFS